MRAERPFCTPAPRRTPCSAPPLRAEQTILHPIRVQNEPFSSLAACRMTALHPASLFRAPPARRTNRLHPTRVQNVPIWRPRACRTAVLHPAPRRTPRSAPHQRAERPFCTRPPRRTPVPRATCAQTEVSCATPARRTDRSAYYLRAGRTVLFCSPSACGTQCFARRLRPERTALDATCIRTTRS